MTMKLSVKRAYDPHAKSDGFRVLVDGLWPRGVTKAKAKIDLWDKGVPPSAKLRSWFHADREGRFKAFTRKYGRELSEGGAPEKLKKALRGKKVVTIITGAKDVERSHVPTLLKHLR